MADEIDFLSSSFLAESPPVTQQHPVLPTEHPVPPTEPDKKPENPPVTAQHPVLPTEHPVPPTEPDKKPPENQDPDPGLHPGGEVESSDGEERVEASVDVQIDIGSAMLGGREQVESWDYRAHHGGRGSPVVESS